MEKHRHLNIGYQWQKSRGHNFMTKSSYVFTKVEVFSLIKYEDEKYSQNFVKKIRSLQHFQPNDCYWQLQVLSFFKYLRYCLNSNFPLFSSPVLSPVRTMDLIHISYAKLTTHLKIQGIKNGYDFKIVHIAV